MTNVDLPRTTKVGICTRYSHHEATYAGLRIAQWAKDHGHSYSLFTPSTDKRDITPEWDAQVVQGKFTDWCKDVEHVVWTTIPHPEQIRYVRSQGAKTSVLLMMNTIHFRDLDTAALAHNVLAPTRDVFEVMFAAGMRHARYVPWEAGFPVCKKPPNHLVEPLHVLLPWWDGNIRRIDPGILPLLEKRLQQHKNLRVTVAYSSSTLPSVFSRYLRRLRRWYPNKLRLAKGLDQFDRLQLFQNHDLTLWCTLHESLGLIGLTSINMGTPIVGFNLRPLAEILTADNSCSVDCVESINEAGAVCAAPNYAGLDDALYRMLRSPGYVRGLQNTICDDARQRKKKFDHLLASVLDEKSKEQE